MQDQKDLEYTPYFGDHDGSQEKLFGDLFDFEARQKAIDAGPLAVAHFRSNRFRRFRATVVQTVAESLRNGRLDDLNEANLAPASKKTKIRGSKRSKETSSKSKGSFTVESLESLAGALKESLEDLAETVFSVTLEIADQITAEVTTRVFADLSFAHVFVTRTIS